MKLGSLLATTAFMTVAGFQTPTVAQNVDSTGAANSSFCDVATSPVGQTFSPPVGVSTISRFGFETRFDSTALVRGELWVWKSGYRIPDAVPLYISELKGTSGAEDELLYFVPSVPIAITPGHTYLILLTMSRDPGVSSGSACITYQFSGTSIVPGELVYPYDPLPSDFQNRMWVATGVDAGVVIEYDGAPPIPPPPPAPPVTPPSTPPQAALTPHEIPTVSEWAMLTLAALLGWVALKTLRVRRPEA